MDRVIVTNPMLGICHMQVCAAADATDDEILAVCNAENPAGTSLGWATVVRSDEEPKMRPVTCSDHRDRKHFLVSC